MHEFRMNGAPLSQVDFGRVLAGQSAAPVVVQLVNTGAADWVDTRLGIVQSDAGGGAGSAACAGLTLTPEMQSVGTLAAGASLDITLSWATPPGATGVASDLANLAFAYDE